MIKIVSFDIGGTLCYSKTKHINKLQKLASFLCVDEKSLKEFLYPYIYCSEVSIEQVSELLIDKYNKDCRHLLNELFKSKNYYIYKDSIEIFNFLKQNNIKIAVISNQNSLTPYNKLLIDEYIDYNLVSYKEGCRKPDKEIFEKLVSISGVKPENILHIGDSINSDYNGAKKAGFNTVLLDRNNNKNGYSKIKTLLEIKKLI